MALHYVDFEHKYSSGFRDLDSKTAFDIKLLHHKNRKAKHKILFVPDQIPREDIEKHKIFSGYTGETFFTLLKATREFYGCTVNEDDCDWLVAGYTGFRTAGKPKQFVADAEKEFTKRLEHLISEYKPDVVVTMGRKPLYALNKDKVLWTKKSSYQHFFGTTIPTKITYKGKSHKFKHVPTISMSSILDSKAVQENSYMLGYVTRNLVTALEGKMRYKIPSLLQDGKPTYRSHLLSTLDEVKKLLRKMAKAPTVSIDTETRNLNRVKNQVLTIQFAKDTEDAYIIPIYHKDSPFSTRELRTIVKLIRSYFETKNRNRRQIYVNAKFDLNIMRTNFGIKFFKAPIWDIFAGEFCFDPETEVLTEEGYIGIDTLVNMENKPKVLSYNNATGESEYQDILHSSRHETDQEMYELEYEGGTLRVTADHKLWSVTRNCYIEIQHMEVDEEVLIIDDD